MSRDIKELHPFVQFLCQRLIDECSKKGIEILVTDTYRSIEEQNKLYAKGRTSPGKIVTNAKGGYSYHNFRLAFDICPLVDGKCAWDRVDLFNKIGAIGTSIGLTWGGNFKSIKDMPHLQWEAGFTLEQLRNGWYPKDPRVDISDSFVDAVNKLVDKGVINSPDYWLKNDNYKAEYVRELIKKVANHIA